MESFPLVIIIALAVLNPAQGLVCNEGFNALIGGLPFYHWKERTCRNDTNVTCVGQEIRKDIGVEVLLRRGGCISAEYANYLECENLFGIDSTFDPAELMDLMPDAQRLLSNIGNDFTIGGPSELQTLLSNGNGSREFVHGAFLLLENAGFNVKGIKPLEGPLSDAFVSVWGDDPGEVAGAMSGVFSAFMSLETDNAELSDRLKNFINNFVNVTELLQNDFGLAIVVEKMPGLIDSVLPDDSKLSTLFNLAFKLLDDVDLENMTNTVLAMADTIDKNLDMPDDFKSAIHNLTLAPPPAVGFVVKTLIAVMHGDIFSQRYFEEVGVKTYATEELSEAVNYYIQSMNPDNETDWVPFEYIAGIVYNFASPEEHLWIDDAYSKIGYGLMKLNLTTLVTSAQTSKLSEVFLSIYMRQMRITDDNPFYAMMAMSVQPFTDTFAAIVYDVFDDFGSQIDDFADTVNAEISADGASEVNVGQLIHDLSVVLNCTLPEKINPILNHGQDIIGMIMVGEMGGGNLTDVLEIIFDEYKVMYPNSSLPDLMKRLINLMAMEPSEDTDLQFNLWSIDVGFAVFRAIDLSSPLQQWLLETFPLYQTRINVMNALDPEAVKEFWKTFWPIRNAMEDMNPEDVVKILKPAVKNITASLVEVMPELREVFGPDACSFIVCDTDLCYFQQYQPLPDDLQMFDVQMEEPEGDSAESIVISYSVLLLSATIALLF